MAPARVGNVLGEVVDDGEAPGTGGGSRGGFLLRRSSATVGSGDLAIGGLWWLIEHGEVTRKSRKGRGVLRCEGIVEGMPPFIGSRLAVGAAARSTRARLLRRRRGLGEGAVVFTSSWRC